MVLRPVLFRSESFAVGSYPFMVLLAAVLAVVTIELRAGRRDVGRSRLLWTVLISRVGGGVGGRVLPVLIHLGPAHVRWSLLNPANQAGLSLSMFLIVAAPLAALCLYGDRRRGLVYFDVAAPSLLLGLAVVKVGCLLAGCCAGQTCTSRWGLTYPYGSIPYARQWRERTVSVPEELLQHRADGRVGLLSEAPRLSASVKEPAVRLEAHAEAHRLGWAELVAAVEAERSRPLWPVPLWYVAAGGVLWLAAESVYRRVARPGATIGFVLCAYGVMRFVFDGFVADLPPWMLNLASTQVLAAVATLLGLLLIAAAWHRGEGATRAAIEE